MRVDVDAAISVRDLVKRFPSVVAVDGVSFDVARGTIFGLLGRNGAGKTTTLETCVGLTKPTSGDVRVLGLDPTRRADFATLRQKVGVQLQSTSLPEKATVAEIFTLYASFYGVAPQPQALADRVGLGDKLERYVGKLSGGEQQRVALALAILHDPDVLFLDEPTAGMDAFGRRILWAEVERLRAEGKAIVLTTHYIEEAERLSDEICVVKEGRIVARGMPAALIAQYGGSAAIAFVARGFEPSNELLAAATWQRDGAGWRVFVEHDPGRLLGTIAGAVNAAGSSIEALSLRTPTLEDAFIAITGEHIDEGKHDR